MTDTKVVAFRDHIIEAGILDPEGIHHEFVSGLHGRKLDFDAIPDSSDLFGEWTEVTAATLKQICRFRPLFRSYVILGVANGTNRLVGPIADLIGRKAMPAQTIKVTPKAVELTPEAVEIVRRHPSLVVAVEDVGTRGTTSASALISAAVAGARRGEALNTWQRRNQLEELDMIGAVHRAIIFEPLPSLPPEECRASGYCAQGWQLIEHAK